MGNDCCGCCDDNEPQNGQTYRNMKNSTSNATTGHLSNSELTNGRSIGRKHVSVRQQNNINSGTATASATTTSQPQSASYQSASREEMLAAAERRAAEQQSRGVKGTTRLKPANAELPDQPNTGPGLRWQLG